MEERNDLIKELFELHKLLADKGEIVIGYGFSKNYNRLKKQVKKLTLTDVVSSASKCYTCDNCGRVRNDAGCIVCGSE
jgi:hypothetical protein